MTEVKLLSIKIKPEHSYFFENDGATFDSNSNKVVVGKASKNEQRMSKKVEKAAEKEQKKQQKKELKQRKKESRKSAKKNLPAKDDNLHEVGSKSDKTVKENGEVNLPQFSNPVFYDGTLEKGKEVNVQENASPVNSGPETKGENVEPETSGENEEPGTSGESVEPETSGENVEPETGGENEQPDSNVDAKEEAITCENSHQSEDEPRDLSWQFKPNPQITELEQGQHVEVEISEVEDMPDSNGTSSESEIVVAIVQEVESAKDLDSFFVEVYGEPGVESQEKRKSVRFEEPQPTEQDPDNRTDVIDGKTENADGEDKVIEVKREEPPVDECVGVDHVSNGESFEVDLDEIFESCEKEGTDTREIGNHRIKIADDDITTNGKSSGGHEEIASKKEKRKNGGLLKCCFS